MARSTQGASTANGRPPQNGSAPPRQAIALVSVEADPAALAGTETLRGQAVYVRQVGEALAKLGWQVDLFARQDSPDAPAIVENAPHCRTVRLPVGPPEPLPPERLIRELPAFARALQQFQNREGTYYPLVHTNNWLSGGVGLELKRHANIQLLHTCHRLSTEGLARGAGPNPHQRAIEQQLLRQADRLVATSPEEVKALQAIAPGVRDASAIDLIPCGTDLNNFHAIPQADARSQLGFDPGDRLVLYVGRFEPSKGLDILIDAFARLVAGRRDGGGDRGLKLVVIGGSDRPADDARDRQRLQPALDRLPEPERVCWVGRVGHDRLPLYYTAADLCAIPSRYEPFGLVALEAMACGTPVVAANTGGLKFAIVPEETGLLVPPEDPDALAAALGRLLDDRDRGHQFGLRGSARVRDRFSWSSVAARLSDLYRRLLAASIAHPELARLSPQPPLPQGVGRQGQPE